MNPAVTSLVVLVLLLAPGLFAIAGADTVPQHAPREPDRAGRPSVRSTGRASAPEAAAAASRDAAAPGGPAAASPAGPPGAGPRSDKGVKLLREAAQAGRTVPYRGVQMISWWGARGATTLVVNVIHQPGSGTLLQTAGTSAQPAASTYVPDAPGVREPGTALGVTDDAIGLLAANYQVAARGTGEAGNRPAQIVEARRTDGTLAARFWVDKATKVPLRRELFDRQSRMINEDAFIDLHVGRGAAAGMPARAATSRPWSHQLTSADLTRLREHGWPLPRRLPGRLSLFEAREAATASGPVLQLGYSDGLSEVSVFLQRGGLPRTLAGYQRLELAGQTVYARASGQPLFTWAGRGYVYTVIADAAAGTVDDVVDALPHQAAPGFWGRLGRGFARIATWADPFR